MSPGWLALLGVGVAVAAFAYDFAIVRHVQALYRAESDDDAVARKAAMHAACWSVAIYAVGLVGVLGVIKVSLWLVVPEAVGLATGSYVGALWRRKVEARDVEIG